MTKHITQIVRVEFENKISDTRPWDLCGCETCEPTRLYWVQYFQRQHDQLYAERAEREAGEKLHDSPVDTHLHTPILSTGT